MDTQGSVSLLGGVRRVLSLSIRAIDSTPLFNDTICVGLVCISKVRLLGSGVLSKGPSS